MQKTKNIKTSGFTLIELSIVLVIIWLIIGGVLTGQDLIKSAEIRAQISQIEKYNTAVNAFKLKYNCTPGDCPNATDYFPNARNGHDLEFGGWDVGAQLFYQLAEAGLIEGKFNGISVHDWAWSSNCQDMLPPLKIGRGFLFSVSSDYISSRFWVLQDCNGDALTPYESFQIDTKIDDGKPHTGRVHTDSIFINTELCLTDTNRNAATTQYNLDPSAANNVSCTMNIYSEEAYPDGWWSDNGW